MNEAMARYAARGAHVLLVEVPGRWRLRSQMERALSARGWRLAMSPADADVLAVCGTPGPSLSEAIERVWQEMPGPRVRIDVRAAERIQARLDEASNALLDSEHHRHDAHARPSAADPGPGDEDHGDMDHGDMDMSPSGIPLAQGGQDRDGLEMDILHLRLGPVLPYWPAGLVLDCAMRGDVVSEVAAEILDGPTDPAESDSAHGAARTLDNVGSLLALAGWDDAAGGARRVRDLILEGADEATTAAKVQRLRRRVERSRVLRWSLRGVRPLDRGHLEGPQLSLRLGGDTYDRLLGMLERVSQHRETAPRQAAFPVGALPGLVDGLDLATARLVIASLDLHDLQPGDAHRAVAHA